MSYWAPTEAKGVEVDFLLRQGRSFVAIEVKSGTRIRPEWFKGLQAISELAGVKRRILVYLGTQALLTDDGIEVLPLKEFLRLLEERGIFR